jgi:hypothetical protein
MKKLLIVFSFAVTLTYISGIASAGVPEVYANDVFHVEPGEVFDAVVFVECHADVANYTVIVTLHPRFEFAPQGSDMNISDDVATITYLGYDTDILRFEFPMTAKNDTPEGDYTTAYASFWNGSETSYMPSQVSSDAITISVGEGTSGSCTTLSFVVFPALGVVSSYTIVKRHKR